MNLIKLSVLDEQKVEDLKEIFFLTSQRKQFLNQQEKEEFYQKYLGCYLQLKAPWNLAYSDNGKILGYIVGDKTSLEYIKFHAYLSLFTEEMKTYPAHLHINIHPTAQGRGLGSKLIENFEKELKKQGVRGVHLLTSPHDLNVKFYHKNGYSFTREREFHQTPLLFMAKLLDS
jgi:ribosomal protein S18 acetylase RimI-like enzyme